jgi:hypothetical protein
MLRSKVLAVAVALMIGQALVGASLLAEGGVPPAPIMQKMTTVIVTVQDRDGRAIGGARVIAQTAVGSDTRTGLTGSSGEFCFQVPRDGRKWLVWATKVTIKGQIVSAKKDLIPDEPTEKITLTLPFNEIPW